jgi:hypothetical protein
MSGPARRTGDPSSIMRLKQQNDDAVRFQNDVKLELRQKGVTMWHERNETRPGASSKDEEASMTM